MTTDAYFVVITIPSYISTPSVFSGVRVTRSLVLCFIDRCLSFCPFSFGHCVVCPSSMYGFWLPLWYLQTLLARKTTVAKQELWGGALLPAWIGKLLSQKKKNSSSFRVENYRVRLCDFLHLSCQFLFLTQVHRKGMQFLLHYIMEKTKGIWMRWWLDFLLQAHCNNSPWVVMSLHSETLYWFHANQFLLLLINSALTFLVEASNTNFIDFVLMRLWLELTVYCPRSEYANYYTTEKYYLDLITHII